MSISTVGLPRREAIQAVRSPVFWPALPASLLGMFLATGICVAQSGIKPSVVPNPVRPATARGAATSGETGAMSGTTTAESSIVANAPTTNRPLFQHMSVWAADSITATLGEETTNTVLLSSAQPQPVVVRIKAPMPDRIPFDDGWRPFLTDLSGSGDPAEITFEDPVLLGRLSTIDTCWQFTAKAKSTPPEGGRPRLLLVELKRDDRLFAKFLVNYIAAAKGVVCPSISLAQTTWAFDWDEAEGSRILPLGVDNTKGQATKISPLKTLLRSEDGILLEEDRFQLSPSPNGPFGREVAVASGVRAIVYLQVTPPAKGGWPHGKLSGNIRLGTEGGTVHELAVVLQAGSGAARIKGIALLAAGLALAAFVAGYFRPRLARIAALRPVVLVKEALARFADSLGPPPAPPVVDPFSTIRAKVVTLEASISPAQLDREALLPRGFDWVGNTDPVPNSPALASRLDGVSNQLGGVRVLVANIQLLQRIQTQLGKIPAIDALALLPLDANAAQARVTAILNATTVLSPAGGGEGLPKIESIDFAIKIGAGLTWLAWAAIALGVGAVWILSQAAFGTIPQLVGCFIYGFASSALGAKLDSIVPAGIASVLKVKIP